jgi:predicted SAM-dependent methyltransferase
MKERLMLSSLKRFVFRTRQWQHRQSAPDKINAYLQSHEIRKLHIGAGPNLLDTWLNTTLQPLKAGSVYFNAIKPFPMPDASFDYIFSEHMIEHVTFPEGQAMLRECFRVLKKGGKIRLSTPDLERMLALYGANPTPEGEAYIRWTVDNFLKDTDGYNPAFVINKIFHGWGHVFIYDFVSLKYALEQVGFVDVQRFRPNESQEAALQNIEQHGKVIQNEDMNQFESLVVEARKL